MKKNMATISDGASFTAPAALVQVMERVRAHNPAATDATDRRGFTQLHWPPTRPNPKGKPNELSLEHEVRLVPTSDRDVDALLGALYRSEGLPVREHLLPDNQEFGDLIVRKYPREPGPQSVDRYYDFHPGFGGDSLIRKMITVRERIATSGFMTWSVSGEDVRPLNLELPFISLGSHGMTARVEFNWIDEFSKVLAEASSAGPDTAVGWANPLFIASQVQGLALSDLVPVLMHTTFRQKFGVYGGDRLSDQNDQFFAVNVDLMIAQNMVDHRVGCNWDIDLSGLRKVDEAELGRVMRFGEAIAAACNLQPNPGTKAWRDAVAVGVIQHA